MTRCLLTLMLFVTLPARADEVSESRRLSGAAIEAYRQKNAAVFLEMSAAASALRPQHAGLLYNLAAAQTMNGRPADALATLRRIAEMGLTVAPNKDPDFAPLQGSAGYQDVLDALARNEQPAGRPAEAFTLRETGQIAEGIAYDAATDRQFVSSVRTKRIFAVSRRGEATVFAELPMSVFGMAIDPKRRLLWAALAALPQTEGFTEADRGKGAVAKIDLGTGRVLAILQPTDAGPHLFGDVAVAPDGEVFASNSAGAIYRVEDGRLEPFARGPFVSLQGLSVAPDGRLLYAADYSKGLFAVDLATRDSYRLPVPSTVSLLGVDGLYQASRNTLIATQNGTTPARVLRIALSPNGLGVASCDVLAANDPRMTDLTLGALHGQQFYFIANAQWGAWDNNGARKAAVTLEPATILRVKVQ